MQIYLFQNQQLFIKVTLSCWPNIPNPTAFTILSVLPLQGSVWISLTCHIIPCKNALWKQPFMRIWLITPRVSKKLCLWQKCYQQISWQKKSSQTYHIVVEASHCACIDFHRFVLFLSVQTTSISRIFGGNKIRIYSSKRSMEKHLGPDTEG